MKTRLSLLIVLGLLLVGVILAAWAWTGRPELISISPQDGATDVPTTAQLRMTFSRPMDEQSVQEHLVIDAAKQGELSWEGNTLVFTPAGAWSGGEEIRVQLEAGAKARSWLAFPMPAWSGSFRTSGELLAYLWPAEGAADIYALNPTTGEVYRYTRDMQVLEFTASQDGLVLYFSGVNTQGGADIYQVERVSVTSPDGPVPQAKRLLSCGLAQCRLPAVSADGTYLAYEYLTTTPRGGMGPAQVWMLRLPGADPTAVGTVEHETIQPAWSSTGWLVYYDRSQGAYEAFHPNTQERLQVANQTGQPGTWSPDGKYLLAPEIFYYRSSRSSETGTSHLLQYDLQSGDPVDLSGDNAVEDVEGIYSPSGGWIAFARKYLEATQWSFGRQLWVMKADGSEQRAITDEPDYNHYDLAWSRDGNRLAYVRFNQAVLSDPPELWMTDADGSNRVQLVIGGYSPLWIP